MKLREKFSLIFQCLRWKENLILMGGPLLGLVLSSPDAFSLPLFKEIRLLLGIFIFYGHVFTFNDWSGLKYDSKDPEKSNRPLHSRKIKPSELLSISAILFILSLILLSFNPAVIYLIVFESVLWILYSLPYTFFKQAPGYSPAIHFLTGCFHFLYGYIVFSGIDKTGVLISVFFGLVFAGGSLNHEIKDFPVEKKSDIMTNAVRMGKNKTFIIHIITFIIAYFYITFISLMNTVDVKLALSIDWIIPIHIFSSFKAYKSGLDRKAIYKYRKIYRTLFIISGIIIFILFL